MSAVASLIEREIALITEFIDVLGKEQEALKLANVSELPALTSAKKELVDSLNALETERLATLGMANGEPGSKLMANWLSNHPLDIDAATMWKKLLGLARQAKALHDMNAALVDMHLRHTGELLSALTQQTTRPPLYGASGQTLSSSGSRIVDSA